MQTQRQRPRLWPENWVRQRMGCEQLQRRQKTLDELRPQPKRRRQKKTMTTRKGEALPTWAEQSLIGDNKTASHATPTLLGLLTSEMMPTHSYICTQAPGI